MLLQDRGRFDDAELLMREALATSRCILGGLHFDTLVSVHNLADLLAKQGRLDEAEALYREALAGRQARAAAA